LFGYLCEKNAVTHNPVKGVKRPSSESNEGKTLPSAIIKRASSSTHRGSYSAFACSSALDPE
jgi:hypothetical protein